MSQGLAGAVEIDPALVEEAVLLVIRDAPPSVSRRFRTDRDAIYQLDDTDAREARFRELHAGWFERLGLAETLRRTLGEQPVALRCLVLRAAGRRAESADLHDAPGASGRAADRLLVVRLTPRTLLDASVLRPLLRRELLHVHDMLDPAFGYERSWTGSGAPGSPVAAVSDRYRLLWDVSVDGRLAARGLLPDNVESVRRLELAATFPMLAEPVAQELFERLFRGPRPRHEDLCAMAGQPAGGARRCALCQLPTRSLQPSPERLDPAILRAIRADRPDWRPEDGLCVQCADLYGSRCPGWGAADGSAGASVGVAEGHGRQLCSTRM